MNEGTVNENEKAICGLHYKDECIWFGEKRKKFERTKQYWL